MAAYGIGQSGQAIIFSSCGFFFLHLLLSSSSSFLSPILSDRKLDVYHTSTHDVALVRILNAGLKSAARGSLKMQDAKNRHLGTVAQYFVGLYLRNEGMHRQSEKIY